MSLPRITRQYQVVMAVEPLENAYFQSFYTFLACFAQNNPFSRGSIDITTQYLPNIFGRLIHTNKSHLLGIFLVSTFYAFFFFQVMKMASKLVQNETFSERPQLSLKFVHTKRHVRQLPNVKENTIVFRLQ